MRCCASSASGSTLPSSTSTASRRCSATPLFLDVFAGDRGGAFLPLALLILVPGAFGWWADPPRPPGARANRRPFWLALLIALVPLAAPANGWREATGQFRLRKVEPLVLAFATDAWAGYADWRRPADFAALAAEHQRRWLRPKHRSRTGAFPTPSAPIWRVPAGPPPAPGSAGTSSISSSRRCAGSKWGVPAARPADRRRRSWTGCATGPDAALWARATSFGMPSINGLFASHCSITPPSRRYITSLHRRRASSASRPCFGSAATAPKCSMAATPTGTIRARVIAPLVRPAVALPRGRGRATGSSSAPPPIGGAAARAGRPALLRHDRLGQQSHAISAPASRRSTSPARRRAPSASATPPIIPTTSSASSGESLQRRALVRAHPDRGDRGRSWLQCRRARPVRRAGRTSIANRCGCR